MSPLSGWGPEGHRIVATIAAAHLDANAQAGVRMLLKSDPASKNILKGKNGATPASLAKAMAAVATWADDVKQQTGTGQWHFLDLASTDLKPDIPQRCPGDECVTKRVEVMTPHLKSGETFTHGNNTFTAAEQLKFIIHLMGDLHQPLHCATNADAGGNCLRTAGFGTSELHAAWDGGMIRKVLLKTTTETALAQSLDQRFSGQLNTIVATTDLGDIAIESHSAAFQNAYGPMLANNLLPAPEPRPFLSLSPSECATKAADFFNIQPHPKLTQLYQMSTFDAVSQQLATGGYRLADLLNRAFQ